MVDGKTKQADVQCMWLCCRANASVVSAAVHRSVVAVAAPMLGDRRLFVVVVSSLLETDAAAGFTLCHVDS